MKILVIHNQYKSQGGEEAVVSAEIDLLREKGHQVVPFFASNEDLERGGFWGMIMRPFRLIWSWPAYLKVREIIRKEKPDLAHIHNTFFVLSPSVYYACHSEGLPVVQTLHNYRFVCPFGILYKDGQFCRQCLDKGIRMSLGNACGTKSIAWRVSIYLVLKVHQMLGTFKKYITTYIALSDFSRRKFIEAGFAADRIRLKPNFINQDPGFTAIKEDFVLYAGRLSPEKGVDLLLGAWEKHRLPRLVIIGSGAQADEFSGYAAAHRLNITFLGHQPTDVVLDHMKRASLAVIPSRCNENFPRTIVEAFSCGTPVIASNNGAIAEIVADGVTGILFKSGDADDLAGKVQSARADPAVMAQIARNARKAYEEKYTAQTNYQMLKGIYEETINNYAKKSPGGL